MKQPYFSSLNFIALLILLVVLFVLVTGLYLSDWKSYDWWVYPQALRNLFSGQSLYQNNYYFNPPWTPVLLLPITWLPVKLGEAVAAAAGLLAYALVASRFGARRLSLTIFLLSPPVLFDLYAGNITWLAMLGLVLPPWLGLFFVLSKPHLGIGIAIYWFVEAWRAGGWKRALKVFAPVSVAFLLSFLAYGPWFLTNRFLVTAPFNNSIFPWGIPVGAVFLFLAVRRRELKLAVASSPFFATYFPLHGWVPLLIGVLPDTRLLLLLNIVLVLATLWVRAG